MLRPVDVLAYRGVSKRFGQHRALDEVSLEVRSGEVLGLLGPNGAGKTTLIRIGLDILRPDQGKVSLFGAAPGPSTLDRVAYLPEERGVYRRAKVLDLLVYLGRLKGLSRDLARDRAAQWLERVGLAELGTQRVESLSKGMSQKVQIAACLMTDPELCILDEPFSGLDPVNVGLVKELIEERRQAGATTVLSTHMMQQVEALCDRVALIHRGRLVVYGALDEVRRRYSPHEVRVWTSADLSDAALGPLAAAAVREDGRRWRVPLPEEATASSYLHELVQRGVAIDRYEPHIAPMDEIFVRVVSGAEP